MQGAKLQEAKLQGATYTKRDHRDMLKTQWPEGFDPDKAGAQAVDEQIDKQEQHEASPAAG